MVDLLRNEVIEKTFDAHVAKFFDINAAAEVLSKLILASSLFVQPFATFVWLKTDTEMDEKKYKVAYA